MLQPEWAHLVVAVSYLFVNDGAGFFVVGCGLEVAAGALVVVSGFGLVISFSVSVALLNSFFSESEPLFDAPQAIREKTANADKTKIRNFFMIPSESKAKNLTGVPDLADTIILAPIARKVKCYLRKI